MALPSLLDTFILVALVLPGFAAFSIARFLAVVEKKLEEFDMIVWSLFMSLGIYLIFSVSTGIGDFDTLRDRILSPLILAIFVVTTLFVGMLIGTTWHLFVNKGKRPRFGDPWDVFLDDVVEKKGRDLVVFTSDGMEFKGWIGPSGSQDNRREIVLQSPTLIIR